MPPFDGTPSRNSPEPLCQKPGLSVRVFLGNGGAKKQTKNYGRGTENGPPKTTTLAVKNEMPGGQKRTPKTGPKKQKKVNQILLFWATTANVFWPTWNTWPTGARPGLSRSSPSRPVCARGPTVADGGKRKKTDAVARHTFAPNLILSISIYLIRSRQPSVSRISCVSGAHAHTKLRR